MPQFNDDTRTARSDFYRRGGAAVAPALTTCAIAPSIPPETTPMQIPTNVMQRIRQFAAAFPVPQAPDADDWNEGDDSRRDAWIHAALRLGWMAKLAGQIRHDFGDRWGRKATSSNAPTSKESIGLNDLPAHLHVWDLLNGAATGRPVLADDPDHHDVPDQHFVPVEPVDHLGAIVAPTNRPTIRTPLWSVSSFDLGARLATGDRRWIDQVLLPHRLVARVVVASWFRRPAEEESWTVQQKLDISRARFRATLAALEAAGLQAHPVLLVDTAKFGLTRAEALEEVRKCHAILLEHPAAVAGVAGGNELTHDVEQPYMNDPTFWAEVDAIIDPRFPFTPGAGHGGEAVSILGGSYLVHHADRGLDAETNAAIMQAGQDIGKRPVIDDEQIGVAEPGTPGQRVYNADYLLASVRECKARGLGGVTYHPHAGLTADVDVLGPVQRDALARFGAFTGGGAVIVPPVVPPTPIPGASVTPEQIAAVVRGGFFQAIATFIGATGTEDEKRPAVSAWMLERITAITQMYLDVFRRPCDLEGFGSCITAILEQDLTDAELRAEKQKAYDRGER